MEIVSATATHVDQCAPLLVNGSGTVTAVNVSGAPGNTGDFSYTWANNAGMTSPLVTNDPLLTQVGLDVGTYYVIARRNAVISPATPGASGSGCATSPVPFTVLDHRVTPAISFATVSSTACDDNFDGRITVTANTASGPGAGAGYNFVWTDDPDGLAGTSFSVSDSPNNTAGPYATQAGDLVGPGPYAIRVTNFTTQCFTNGSVILQQNTLPVEILTASATPQQMCTTPGDGSVGVALADVRVGGNPVGAGITFAWTDDNGNPVGAGTSILNLNAGSYIVQATRTSGVAPASGCVSAPVQVVVADDRQYPVLGFSTIANTTCNNTFDGEITLTATTTGIGNAANYDIDWTNNPGGAVVIANALNVASPYTTSAADNIGVGDYTVIVTNTLTNCASDGAVSVLQNTTPVQIWDVAKIDQRDCAPFDGSITIDTNDPAHVSVTGPYTFAWEKGGVALAPVPDNILSGVDGGVYTVTGTKANGVGAGCVTNPFQITLLDLTEKPVLELQSIRNFACDPALANGQVSAIIFEGNSVASPADFNLQWFAGKNTTVGPVLGMSDVLPNQVQGDYTLVAVDNASPNLGCRNVATTAIGFDATTFSVTVAATDQDLCAPAQNGSVTVTSLTEVRNGVSTPAANLGLFGFQWSDQAGVPHPSTPAYVNGANALNNLLAGKYMVRVRNA
ncbi:MAG: hypothetical protein M3Y60_00405, partial [Bacteroidota bacterium]|nr:hypothetical protein [Bacteroidota bacterium]